MLFSVLFLEVIFALDLLAQISKRIHYIVAVSRIVSVSWCMLSTMLLLKSEDEFVWFESRFSVNYWLIHFLNSLDSTAFESEMLA